MDVSGYAIRRLITAGLFPIAIYVKPRDIKWILYAIDLNFLFVRIKMFLSFCFRENMGGEVNEERAQQMYEKSMKIEQQFGDLLASMLN